MSGNIKKKFNIFDYFRDLEKFYGALYLLLLCFLIFLGAKYAKTLDYNKVFSSPVLLAADSNMRTQLPVKKGTISPPVDAMKLGGVLPADIKEAVLTKGKDLYTTNCVSCHGETGHGNGPAGAALNPPPRNFADPLKQTWKNGPKISQMYITLQDGIPNTGMASFSNITPEDRFAILQYVHTFSPDYPKDSPDDLTKLDEKYSLSKGVKMPNQIPIDLAMDLELLNYDTLKSDIDNVLKKIESAKNDSASLIFDEIVSNKLTALYSLSADTAWNVNAEQFVQFIETDPINKGFKATVFQLSPEKANQIYQYLKNLFEKNKV